MNRRQFIASTGGIAISAIADTASADPAPAKSTGLGLVAYCQSLRRKQMQTAAAGEDLFAPLTFLNHCHGLGAGGIQVSLGPLTEAESLKLRRECDNRQMFLEAIISLPKADNDLDRFRTEMKSAAAAGARAVRCVIISGRRYENYKTLEQFRTADRAGGQMLERAAPIADEVKLPLAVENHKDHRNLERVRLFERISSEYVGACVDTGNSVALLEDPLETVRSLARWVNAVHLKDQALRPHPEGFLLGDIALGQGDLDLPGIVRILREKKPDLPMALELITRDPLLVPCLTERYWGTFPDLPASDLARTLRLVSSAKETPLTQVSSLPMDEQVAVELANVRQSLDYARDVLKL